MDLIEIEKPSPERKEEMKLKSDDLDQMMKTIQPFLKNKKYLKNRTSEWSTLE